jgi:hypothetical protein
MVASIEYIERVISTYGQAEQANWKTTARAGNTIVVTPDLGDDVLVAGDLHGHRPNFNAILKVAALDDHPRRHLVVQEVCHGGPAYPSNGGCMSHSMLEDVAALKVKYPDRVHFMLGNHELAELTDFPIVKNQKMLNLFFRYGLQEMYGPATEKVREACLAFLKSCPLAVRLPGGLFVSHSLPECLDQVGFDKGILDRPLDFPDYRDRGSVFNMLWGRDYRSENAEIFARLIEANVLIHGHDPCSQGYRVPNGVQVIIDCSSKPAAYLLLPTGEELSHAEVVKRIALLP